MKRIIAFILAAVMLAGMFAGCTPQEDPYVPTGDALDVENTVSPTQNTAAGGLALAYYPDRSMNPFTCTDYTNKMVLSLIYQGLFTVDKNYQVTPMLCNGYRVSRDLRTYTFYVTQGATFSDGTTVTPQDVVASLEKAMESPVYSGRFSRVESVQILADGGIQVALDTPYENFPILLDVPIVKADQVNADTPLGTGPYMLETVLTGLRLRRRTVWWCKSTDLLATVSYIPLTAVNSTVDIRNAFEAQSVNLVCTDPGSPTYAQFRCDYELWDCEADGFLYLVADVDSEVFSNPAVRKALTHAIDRDFLVDTYYRGFAQSATLPASPNSPLYDKKLAQRYGYDPQIMKDAIQEAGLEGAPITILLNSDDGTRLRVGRAIAKMLEECGLAVSTLELTVDQFLIHVEWSEYDLYLGQTKLSANMDLSEYFETDGTMHYFSLENPGMYAMSLEALANSGNVYDLHRLVMEDGRLCPVLFRSYGVYTQRGMLPGLNATRDNMFQYTIGVSMEDILLEDQ